MTALYGSRWEVHNSLGQVIGRFATQAQANSYAKRDPRHVIVYTPNGQQTAY